MTGKAPKIPYPIYTHSLTKNGKKNTSIINIQHIKHVKCYTFFCEDKYIQRQAVSPSLKSGILIISLE